MSAAREMRESEKIWSIIWAVIPSMAIALWYPMHDEAKDYIKFIWAKLDELEKQLDSEASPLIKP